MRGGRGRGPWGGGPEPDLTARPGSGPRTLRLIVGFFRPYRSRLLLIAGLILVSVTIGVVNPILLKLIIDNLLGPKDLGLLYLQVALMIVLPFVSSGIGVWQSYLSNVVGQRVMDDLRLALYTHLQWMPLRFFTETRTGEIQSRIGNDVNGVQSVVTDTAASLLSNFATVATTVIAMIILDWRLTILSLGMLPVFAYITYRVGRVRREVSTLTQRSLAEVSAITEESLSVSGILLSKTFGQQRASVARFAKESRRLGDLQIRQQMVGRWFFAMIGTFFSIAPAFVYLLAGSLIIGGDTNVSVGTIVAFTTLQSRLFFPLGQLLNVQVEIQGALALFDRIFEYLEMEQEIRDAPDAVTLDPTAMHGDVRFDHVSFRYPRTALQLAAQAEADEAEAAGRAVRLPVRPFGLEEIDFEARPGQLVALVGPSGSGKTTTTYLIPRLYDVDQGAVLIDGLDVRRIALESLGREIGVVTQETYLFHNSVLENLRYARPDASMEEIEAAARAAAIHDRILELPEGYDTIVGERGYKLSGGEKQRVAIARVLLKDPRVLILDEATSALDTVSERLIQAALNRLMEGRTTIAIAHRLSTILKADLILVYDRGRIVERGTHDELIRHEGLYARLYAEQFASEQPISEQPV
ncbi:MAG TPA: ABC transporter ATP-binding protein [Candidatus Limnocylindria bacterium]|jgi:ATP-binding cassette subfamily B protein|nr:ABC transporter ATP-binding protein [Candidatus Limnocylindria bacterium]